MRQYLLQHRETKKYVNFEFDCNLHGIWIHVPVYTKDRKRARIFCEADVRSIITGHYNSCDIQNMDMNEFDLIEIVQSYKKPVKLVDKFFVDAL